MKNMRSFYATLLAGLLLFPSQTVFSEAEALGGPDEIASPGIYNGSESPAEDDEKDAASTTDGLYNVTLPVNLDFTIDHLEIRGRGSVFSEPYMVENHGDVDVALVVTGVEVTPSEGVDIEPLSEPFDMETESDAKAIYILMDFGRDGIEPVVMTAPENSVMPVIPLYAFGRENSFCTISISGSVNPYPEEKWAAGDVKIKLIYTIEPLEAEEEAFEEEMSDEDPVSEEPAEEPAEDGGEDGEDEEDEEDRRIATPANLKPEISDEEDGIPQT